MGFTSQLSSYVPRFFACEMGPALRSPGLAVMRCSAQLSQRLVKVRAQGTEQSRRGSPLSPLPASSGREPRPLTPYLLSLV